VTTKILLVDDRRENLLALSSLIEAPDVQILCASSGNDALALLLDQGDLALALIDVQMPGMSGFELARLMRLAERSRSIPIIFVTASQRADEQIFEGYEKGAVDYLLKPLNAHVVRSKVRVFVELDQKSKALRHKSELLEQKLSEVEMLREAAEAASRAKSRFLANISHEIRTPLGAVLGYADLMRYHDQQPDERESCLAAITRNGQLLQKLIDDILDLAKIEADRVEVERIDMPIAELLLDLQAVHGNLAASKGVTLSIVPEGRVPRRIFSDPLRLKQILNNIVGNAVKFTSTGEVEIRIRCDKLLHFIVRDTGPGLSPTEAVRLFQPFMQADSSTKRRYGGTGLGLVLSKQLAQILGGDVILKQSHPERGATFEVTVDPGPIEADAWTCAAGLLDAAAAQPTKEGLAKIRLDGVRILVADDAPDNRMLVKRLLAHAGAVVEAAENGREAVMKALTSTFDLILMDIQMPLMDGYEATSSLRARGYQGPIIALTAHAMLEEQERCLAAGCNAHLGKPINYRRLLVTAAAYARGDHGLAH